MGTAIVFDPDADYGKVAGFRKANALPAGVHLVASVTGPWKLVSIIDFDRLDAFPGLVDGLVGGAGDVDPASALVIGWPQVKRSVYGEHMAFVRIDVRVPDPEQIRTDLEAAVGSHEVDVVAGDFDVLACVADDDEEAFRNKIYAIRAIPEVKRTVSLRVIDYLVKLDVEEPDRVPAGHGIPV